MVDVEITSDLPTHPNTRSLSLDNQTCSKFNHCMQHTPVPVLSIRKYSSQQLQTET